MTRLAAAARRVGWAASTAVHAIGRIRPRRCVGAVQGPPQLTGEGVVWGWVRSRRGDLAAVVVTIDGAATAMAEFGSTPSDVAVVRRSTRRSVTLSWSAAMEVSDRVGDTLEVGALAVSRRGLAEPLPGIRSLVVADQTPPLPGVLEVPTDGSPVAPGLVNVEGWTLPAEPLDRVEIRLNGREAGLARPLSQARPDLTPRYRYPATPLAGFTHTVAVNGSPGDVFRIEATAVGHKGSRFELRPVTVFVEDLSPAASVDEARMGQVRARTRLVATDPRLAPHEGLRLAVFTHRLDLGGGQLYLTELLRHLLAAPDVSCLVVTSADGLLRTELESRGATVHVTDYPVTSPEGYEDKLFELAQLVRSHDSNAAIVNTVVAGIGADLMQLLEIPTVWAIHESFSPDEIWVAAYGPGGFHPYIREQQATALASTAAVVFEADATRELYRSAGDPRRLVTVPYGIPIDGIDAYRRRIDPMELREAAGIDADAMVLLCMGTYEPRKGQGALVAAFARIAAEFPNAVLVLVGDVDIPYAAAVHDVVRRLQLADRVRLVPVVRDTYAWYAIADAFVIASDVESLPRSVLEVMAFGVPVLASAVFGLPELIVDGENGLLFAPRDVGELGRALRRVLEMSASQRAAIGAAGAATVRDHHDSRGYAAAYDRLLRGLLVDPTRLPGDLLAS